jgi:hypothetical protein
MGATAKNPLSDDLLEGADAIAAFLDWKPRKVRHLAAQGAMPVFRLGDGQILNARKSTLVRWINDLDAAALQAALKCGEAR